MANQPPDTTVTQISYIAWGPVLICFGVLATTFLLAFFLPEWVRNYGAPHDWSQRLMPEMTNNLALEFAGASVPERQRLLEQVQSLSGRAEHHFQVMQYFYTMYYVSLLLGSICAGLAAIALLLISKAGWEKSNPCLISFFLATTVCTIFFVAFPKLCKHEENVSKNKLLYLKYVGLLNDARTYAATGDYVRDDKSTNTVSTLDFIKYLDAEMKRANDIAVSFDPGKFPVYKISTESPKP